MIGAKPDVEMVSHRAGFVLIGLLVVVAIILILSVMNLQNVGNAVGGDGNQATGKQKIDDLMEKAYGLTPCERRRCSLESEIRKFKERKGKYPKTLRGLGWFHFIPLRCPDTDQAYSYDSNTGQVSCSRCDAKKEQQKNKYRYKGRKSVGGGG